ncbi:MAG: L-serine ammonia-lyase, iron-sulfur-dependent subunit beta [Cyclobacteriaceae bacterium]|nr:L-serine ammonia-lyase, iron-sulfur-dependent subunit beta [Cyclobacteriaceae bacterium HetDA_MAG_MS6]
MAEKSSVFDMIGPVMIGPSSSHTAGVVRIGRVANRIIGQAPKRVQITFFNSFARTYEGHGSDRAILAGLMDFKTDDVRIRDAVSLAKESGLRYTFKSVGNASTLHPNTVKLEAEVDNRSVVVVGESRGGGVIRIKEVNGFYSNFTANLHTLIIAATDIPGSIAFITDVLSHDHCNIATMTVSRKGKNDTAYQIIEMDSGLKPITLEYLKQLSWVENILYIPDIDN